MLYFSGNIDVLFKKMCSMCERSTKRKHEMEIVKKKENRDRILYTV